MNSLFSYTVVHSSTPTYDPHRVGNVTSPVHDDSIDILYISTTIANGCVCLFACLFDTDFHLKGTHVCETETEKERERKRKRERTV